VIDAYDLDAGSLRGWKITISSANIVTTYAWSPSAGLSSTTQATPTVSLLDSATYTVVVTDNKGCTNSKAMAVNLFPLATASVSASNIICGGSASGSITVNPVTGTSPFSYSLDNVLFVRARADQIDELFTPKTVESIWLTFPDPFPRKHSAGRRMTHPKFLKKYATILASGGSFLLKHDNIDFFAWSLEKLVGQKWHIAELSFDLHSSDLVDDYKIKTTYEQRWLDDGRKTHFLRAVVNP
jgi:hypothetical protein